MKRRKIQCQAMTKVGKSCQAPAMSGGLCFFHANPKKASELGRKGGSRRKRQLSLEDRARPLPAPDSVTAVRDVIRVLIKEVHSGRLDPQRARCIVPLLSLKVRWLEVNSREDAYGPPPPGATFVEAYEADWLREKKLNWAKQLEQKHADKFPKRGD